jgi:hypothetical protein
VSIGENPASTNDLAGDLDEVAVFGTALSATQVALIFARGRDFDIAGGDPLPAVTVTNCPDLMASINAAADQEDPFGLTSAEHQNGDACLAVAPPVGERTDQ